MTLTRTGGRAMGKKVLTEFGATVLALMAERGITSQEALARLLREKGFEITQTSISAWLYGKYSAPPGFPETLVEALQLNESQKMRLAVAYSYGQRRPLDGPTTA